MLVGFSRSSLFVGCLNGRLLPQDVVGFNIREYLFYSLMKNTAEYEKSQALWSFQPILMAVARGGGLGGRGRDEGGGGGGAAKYVLERLGSFRYGVAWLLLKNHHLSWIGFCKWHFRPRTHKFLATTMNATAIELVTTPTGSEILAIERKCISPLGQYRPIFHAASNSYQIRRTPYCFTINQCLQLLTTEKKNIYRI